MKLTQLILAGISSAAILALVPAKAQIISQWSFENDAVATNNTPAPSTGTGTADSIGMNIYATPNVGVTQDDVVVGKSSDTGANGVADTTNTWRVRGQAGTGGAANGWSSAAPIGTQGAQFFASTAAANPSDISLTVSFDWYATTQGEANLMLEYTTNGGSTWSAPVALTLGGSDSGLQVLNNTTSANTVTGSYVSDNLLTGGSKAGQDWFTGLTATIYDPNAINDSGFGIQLVNASTGADDVSTQGTALNNSSGNWRFDNISITATPEPRSWVLGLGAFATMLALIFGRRKNARR
jgi:hypothetical protein